MKIGIIGTGKMGSAMLNGILKFESPKNIFINNIEEEFSLTLEKELGVKSVSKKELIKNSDIIIIAVKPKDFLELASEIKGNKLFLSIMAGIKIETLIQKLNSKKIIRVMPNMCISVDAGCSAYAYTKDVKKEELDYVKKILESSGTAIEVDEKYMDIVTAISGSGPAFVAYIIDAFTTAGVKNGLSKEDSYSLALQTFYGTSKLLKETKITPNELIKNVASKGGTTEAGLSVLDNSEIRKIIFDTVLKAKKRSEELGKWMKTRFKK